MEPAISAVISEGGAPLEESARRGGGARDRHRERRRRDPWTARGISSRGGRDRGGAIRLAEVDGGWSSCGLPRAVAGAGDDRGRGGGNRRDLAEGSRRASRRAGGLPDAAGALRRDVPARDHAEADGAGAGRVGL